MKDEDFEKIYNESDKLEQASKTKNETTPFEDTPQAWYELDTTGPENEDVVCGNFVWHREKSNKNIKDTGDGKGFSFYLARYVFEDPYSVEIENETNPENDKTLGIVAENNVMVVINAKVENDKIRIISAWEALPQSKYTSIYNKHKAKKQLLENKFSKKTESRKQLYAVIRQADGNGFKPSSYAKVVNTSILKPTDLNTIALFGDKRVYVQNVGDKAYCEQIEKRIKFILDYRNMGENW